MKSLLPLLALPATTALVTTTDWTTSRIVSIISPQYHFHPIYASIVTANATATVYALDCEDQFDTEFSPDNPLAGCAGFTSLLAVVHIPTPSVTSVTFTATSTGKFGTRTISNDCTYDAASMVCTSRLAGDTVPEESQGDRVDRMPVVSKWASGEKFTVTAGLGYLPAETTEATTTATSGTGAATTGSGGGVGPKKTGTSGAMGRGWEGMGVVGVGAMGVVVRLV